MSESGLRITVGPLDVIAATLALPIVESQLEDLAREPTGNTEAARRRWDELRTLRAPLLARRDQLLEVILTGTRATTVEPGPAQADQSPFEEPS